jgi:hypothetical protein
MARYRRKPTVIDAVQWDGANTAAVARLFGTDLEAIGPQGRAGERLVVRTSAGMVTASRGDWVIRGALGGPGKASPEEFEASYEQLGEVADD